MGRRLELDAIFRKIINITDPTDGDSHVYFQPPESCKMKYPAIRYTLKGYRQLKANDGTYGSSPFYEVTLIDQNPDSSYVKELLELPYSSFDRAYSANNLNHFVFIIY